MYFGSTNLDFSTRVTAMLKTTLNTSVVIAAAETELVERISATNLPHSLGADLHQL